MKKKGLILLILMMVTLSACGGKQDGKGDGKGGTQTPEGSTAPTTGNEAFIGDWTGDIAIPNAPLGVIIHIEKDQATMSVPIQNMTKQPFTKASYDGDQVSLTMNLGGSIVQIDGKLAKGAITAKFAQNGQTFDLILSKRLEEQQDGEVLQIPVNKGMLDVVLKLPIEDSKELEDTKGTPIGVIIAGSGPTDKNGNSIGMNGQNNSYKMLAEALAEQGIATIRYDKRGIGDNAGLAQQESDMRLEDFIEDVVSIVQFAHKDKRFSSVSLIGHSEGSLIGMAAAQKENVASFISLAGAGQSADKVLLEQLEGQLPAELLKEAKEIIAKLVAGQQVDEVSKDLASLFRPSVQPYLISWFAHDPAKLIAALQIPVLIANGTHDIQVGVADAQLLKDAKPDAKLLLVEGMNHVLKAAPADREGNIATYTDSSLPVVEELSATIVSFLKENAK